MSGAGICGVGQQLSGSQSAGLGQPALNENPTLESCGSNPEGGSVRPAPATIVSVYGEKSPLASRLSVSTNGLAVVAGTTETTLIADPLPSVDAITKFAGVRAFARVSGSALFSSVKASCVPHGVLPTTSR